MHQRASVGSFARLRWLLPALLLLATGCAPPGDTLKSRYFWPPPPDTPRIEYLDFYQADEDVVAPARSPAAEIVFGRERPKAIFQKPMALASPGRHAVYVTDAVVGKVAILDIAGHDIRFLKDHEGNDKTLGLPVGIALDDEGQIFVVDSREGEVAVFGPDEVYRRSFGKDLLERPVGIAVDDARGLIYVADTGAHGLAVFDLGGALLQRVGERGTGPLQFNYPLDVDVDPYGSVYVLDSMNARVQVLGPDLEFSHTFGERGTNPGSFKVPKGIAVSRFGPVYVTDSLGHNLNIYDREGNFLLALGGKYWAGEGKMAPGGFYLPEGVDVAPDGSLWIADSLNRTIHQFQFLTDAWLEEHPILPGQAVVPPELEGLMPGEATTPGQGSPQSE